MTLTQQRFNEYFPRDLAQVFVFGLGDHAQRLIGVLGQADLNGLEVERHASPFAVGENCDRAHREITARYPASAFAVESDGFSYNLFQIFQPVKAPRCRHSIWLSARINAIVALHSPLGVFMPDFPGGQMPHCYTGISPQQKFAGSLITRPAVKGGAPATRQFASKIKALSGQFTLREAARHGTEECAGVVGARRGDGGWAAKPNKMIDFLPMKNRIMKFSVTGRDIAPCAERLRSAIFMNDFWIASARRHAYKGRVDIGTGEALPRLETDRQKLAGHEGSRSFRQALVEGGGCAACAHALAGNWEFAHHSEPVQQVTSKLVVTGRLVRGGKRGCHATSRLMPRKWSARV